MIFLLNIVEFQKMFEDLIEFVEKLNFFLFELQDRVFLCKSFV